MQIRILSEAWVAFEERLLARKDVETAGVIIAETLPAADGPVLMARDLIVWPEDGYLERTADFIRLDPVAINRLTRSARLEGLSVFTVHSHPGCDDAWFSLADDRGDARLMPGFHLQMPGVPHGSIVVTGTGRVAARAFRADGVANEMKVSLVGSQLRCPQSIPGATEEQYARQVLALGEHGQHLLRRIRVGVVGLGGIGSVVALQLLHQGVGTLVLVDGDTVEATNTSRILGCGPGDVGMRKVDVVARYARQHALHPSIVCIPEHLRDEGQLAHLRSCDVILSCVDRHRPRAMLNRLSYQARIPLIDTGTGFSVNADGRMVGDAGRVVVVGPTRACLGCWGHLDPEALRIEDLPPAERVSLAQEGYIRGADVPQPSVIAFNTMVAGAAVIELLRLVTGFSDGTPPPQRLAFSFSQGTVRRNSLAAPVQCAICGFSHIRKAS